MSPKEQELANSPAFPGDRYRLNPHGIEQIGEHTFRCPGMTLRAYFAAHAPWPPHDWFRPIVPPEPQAAYVGDEGTAFAGCTFKDWMEAERVCGENFSNRNYAAQESWRKARDVAAMMQWPLAYADALIAELAKPIAPGSPGE